MYLKGRFDYLDSKHGRANEMNSFKINELYGYNMGMKNIMKYNCVWQDDKYCYFIAENDKLRTAYIEDICSDVSQFKKLYMMINRYSAYYNVYFLNKKLAEEFVETSDKYGSKWILESKIDDLIALNDGHNKAISKNNNLINEYKEELNKIIKELQEE